MIFLVGWDKRQLSRAGPPLGEDFHWWAGARIRSLVPPYFLPIHKFLLRTTLKLHDLRSVGGRSEERSDVREGSLLLNVRAILKRPETVQQHQDNRRDNPHTDIVVDSGTNGFGNRGHHNGW